MGLFLSMSGVIGADTASVQKVLSEISIDNEGGFGLCKGTTDQPNIGVITTEGNKTSVLYPDGFIQWDIYSAAISKKLNVPVFSFHIHDGDFWMYILFQNGIEHDWFNHSPETPDSQLLFYQTEDGHTRIEVQFKGETVWLSLKPNGRTISAGQVGYFKAHP